MKRLQFVSLVCGLACALLALAPRASASDGVILINQATAARNGGALPGCTAQTGFLITVCRSGSYQLAGNLTVNGAGASGIYIGASNVTLNLGGFTLSDSGGNGGTGVQIGLVNAGVSEVSYDNVTLENGIITGFEVGVAEPWVSAATEHGFPDFQVAPEPVGLTVRTLTVGYQFEGIGVPETISVLVEDSTLYNVGSTSGTGAVIASGVVARTSIRDETGTGIEAGKAVAYGDSIEAASPLVGQVVAAGNNECNGSAC